MIKNHPNHDPQNYYTTTQRASYNSPTTQAKPNWRSRDPELRFENCAKLQFKKVTSDKLATGYGSNYQLWDGTEWKTEKNLHTDQHRTAYRNGFNVPKPFHKPELKNNDGRLRRKELVFDVIDK